MGNSDGRNIKMVIGMRLIPFCVHVINFSPDSMKEMEAHCCRNNPAYVTKVDKRSAAQSKVINYWRNKKC